ncbi:MAG: hypothetical protein [Circular genetic element sp.]|nr:MAG: hypothetical protein [Circular genetic element sp.]
MPRSSTECYPSRAHCLVHNHGGIASANADSPSTSTGSGGGMAVYKMTKKGGSHLKTIGMEQMAMSTQSMPARREWTNLTKAQHKELRLVSPTNPMAGEPVSKKRFDYKPAGTKRGATKRQDAHFRRQPRTGKYSQVSPGKVKIHRAKKFTKGASVYGAGKVLPVLGAGFYIYDVARTDDPVTKVVKDVVWAITNPLEFGYEATGAGTLQRTTFSGESQRVKNINYRTEFLKSLWPF